MKLYVPEIGERLKLTSPWTFDLWPESRNVFFAQGITGKDYTHGDYNYRTNEDFRGVWRITDGNYKDLVTPKEKLVVTLPVDSILSVDRVYIRKGNKDFSSLSFRHIKGHGRFWAKLIDVNNIEFELV